MILSTVKSRAFSAPGFSSESSRRSTPLRIAEAAFLMIVIAVAGCGNPSAPDDDGEIKISSISVPAGPTPVICVNDKVYVASVNMDWGTFEYGSGYLTIVDAESFEPIDTVAAGMNPQALLLASSGDIWIACSGDYAAVPGSLLRFDPFAGAVVDSIETGGTPAFLAEGTGGIIYAAGFANGLLAVDGTTGEILADAGNPIGFGGFGLTADPGSDRVYVSNFAGDIVEVVETDGVGGMTVVDTFQTGDGPGALQIVDQDLFVMNGLGQTLTRIDLGTGAVDLNAVVVGQAPNTFFYSSTDDKLFVVCSLSNDIYELDPNTLDVNRTIDVGVNMNPMAMTMDLDGDIFVTAMMADSLLLIQF